MTETKQAGFGAQTAEDAQAPSLPRPSRRDYALYVSDLSAELARLADSGGLPQEVGYCLRMAASSATMTARTSGGGPRRGKADS